MKKMIFLSLLIMFHMNSYSYWKNSLSIGTNYDENPFHFLGSEKVNVNSANLAFNYYSFDNKLGISLNTNYSIIPNLNYSQMNDNSIGIKYSIPLDLNNQSELNLSGLAGFKNNSQDFSSYNNNHFDLMFSFNYKFDEVSNLSIGNLSSLKDYYLISGFSYYENSIFMGYKTSFETKTSISAEIDYNIKNFTDNFLNFSEQRKNSRQIDNSSKFSQLIASFKIAQSLADRTGLSLLLSKSLDGSSQSSSNFTYNPALVFEKDIYDDPYSYTSDEAVLTLSHYIFWDIKTQIYGNYNAKKYYYNLSAMDSLLTENRIDDVIGVGLNLEKVFSNVKLNINYTYTNNKSSIELFNFKSNYIGINFKLGF